jgi:GNAT superfamily N-acetyltransferase
MRIRKIALDDDNLIRLNRMEKICFPEIERGALGPYDKKSAEWWFSYNDTNTPKAFAGAKMWEPDNCVFLCLSGVLPEARGKGLQKRLIRVRLKWAKKMKAKGAYTYTADDNLASANSLIGCGFKLFEPSYKWGLDDGLYWYIDIK